MDSPRRIDVNTYNINDRKFGFRNDDIDDDQSSFNNNNNNNTSQTRANISYDNQLRFNPNNNSQSAYVNEYVPELQQRDLNTSNNEPIQVNNPIYYQQQQQQPRIQARSGSANGSVSGSQRPSPLPRGNTPPAGLQQQQENEMANRRLYGVEEDEDEANQNAVAMRSAPNQELYFNSRVRNTGYWGKVTLRRGTWMVIIGLFFMAIALTIISVFWAFWYHPAANIPCRVIGITMLVWSTFTVIAGLISNWCMVSDPIAKYFIGSPVRWTSWVMLGSSIAITIASVLITIYYTYWHNRWVNTPMIIIAIVFYFFGGLAFIFSFFYNFKLMMIDIKRARMAPGEIEVESESDATDEDEDVNDEKLDELYALKMANPFVATTQVESDGTKKDFRKKVVQLKPRNLLDTSYQNVLNTSNVDQSFSTINSKK